MIETVKQISVNDGQNVNSNQTVPDKKVQSDINVTNVFDEEIKENTPEVSEENIINLERQLSEVSAKHGKILDAWNGFKEYLGIGSSESKCEDVIEQYKKGEITFEKASAKIEEFAQRQDSSLNLFANIASGVAAIAVSTLAVAATGGAAAVPLLAAVGTGAATKIGFKVVDRATNDVDGDVADAEQIIRDGLSGAVNGGLAAITAGTGASAFAEGGVKQCIKNSTRTGFITGAVSGGANYTIENSFNDEKDFTAKGLVANTLSGSLIGGTVGATMGSVNSYLRVNDVLKAADTSIIANGTSSAGYKILNDRIRAMA